jgi:phage repressor protein C with HTH and peptisase S24 domain
MKEFKEFGFRLTKSVKDAGLDGPADLARLTGLNRVTLGAYMRGDRAASLEACIIMGKALKVDAYWLHSGAKENIIRGGQRAAKHEEYKPPKFVLKEDSNASLQNDSLTNNAGNVTFSIDSNQNIATHRSIPLYSAALAGPDGSISIGASVLEMIEAPAAVAAVPDAYAVRVVGESMEPRYQSGETVYVHPRMPVKKGDYVLVQIIEDNNDGAVMGYIKRLVSIDDKRLIVEQLNPDKEMVFARNRVKSVHRIVLAG